MKKPKIVFFDVDHTLFSHTIHAIPASTLLAMKQLQEQDIKVFLATGRHYCELQDLDVDSFSFDGYVLLTGQLCMNQNLEILYHNPLPQSDQKELVNIFNENKVATLLVNKEDCYINIVDEHVRLISEQFSGSPPKIGSYSDEDIYQAALFATKEEAEEIISRLPNCKLESWSSNGFDIISKSGGKTIGIQKICDQYGIDIEETMAFGDASNDIDMLKMVGLGICMGNGTKEAKEAADFVTKHIDEDGIYFALKHFHII